MVISSLSLGLPSQILIEAFWIYIFYFYFQFHILIHTYSLRSEIVYILATKFILKYSTLYLLVNNNVENEVILLSSLDVVIFNVAWIGCSHISSTNKCNESGFGVQMGTCAPSLYRWICSKIVTLQTATKRRQICIQPRARGDKAMEGAPLSFCCCLPPRISAPSSTVATARTWGRAFEHGGRG
jgi:hypothetical protein